MNAYYQAAKTAKDTNQPPPPKEMYLSRIKYTTPDSSLTVITPEGRVELLQARDALLSALTQLTPYVKFEEKPSAQQIALRAVYQAAIASERLLARLINQESSNP